MAKKSTPAQTFAKLFAVYVDQNARQEERDAAKRRLDSWLKRHDKTWGDAPAILLQAAADDAAAQPPPPPSDPRDAASHPFDDPQFTAGDLVEAATARYLTMKPYVRVLYVLWICFTHVFQKFTIAPRLLFTSEDSGAGKTVAIEVAKYLTFRPNPETYGSGAAIIEFLDEGPGTVFMDEGDNFDAEAMKSYQLIWNVGHYHKGKKSLKIKGKRKLLNLYAPMATASIGEGFLAPTQKTRTYKLPMEKVDGSKERPEPQRAFYDETAEQLEHLNQIYSFLRHWAGSVKLNLHPSRPDGVLGRDADNARGFLAVADSFGPEWGRRTREVIKTALELQKTEKSEHVMVRHGLAIFEVLEVEKIKSTHFNTELKRLDLPDARWIRYCGAGGRDQAHPIMMYEQAAELRKVGIVSKQMRLTPKAKQCNGYTRSQFREAAREYTIKSPSDVEVEIARARLRLVGPASD